MSFVDGNCAETVRQIPFYVYGEIASEMEERVESHLSGCPSCRQELARHRLFLAALDQREDPVEGTLLAACRTDLRSRLARESGSPGGIARGGGWLRRLGEIPGMHIPFRIPLGAMALVLLGWFGARFAPANFGGVRAGVTEPMFSTVQSVEPGAAGNVQIAVDDVQRHMVVGNLRDPQIQALLLNAVREESNPGVRIDSIAILQNGADSDQVRGALVYAVTHDPNAGVRLKAIGGLKQYAGDASVRKAVADVLLKDEDPGIRGQAIDLLTAHHDASIVGALQDAVQKEDDNYIRTRCRKLLEAMKASVGTY